MTFCSRETGLLTVHWLPVLLGASPPRGLAWTHTHAHAHAQTHTDTHDPVGPLSPTGVPGQMPGGAAPCGRATVTPAESLSSALHPIFSPTVRGRPGSRKPFLDSSWQLLRRAVSWEDDGRCSAPSFPWDRGPCASGEPPSLGAWHSWCCLVSCFRRAGPLGPPIRATAGGAQEGHVACVLGQTVKRWLASVASTFSPCTPCCRPDASCVSGLRRFTCPLSASPSANLCPPHPPVWASGDLQIVVQPEQLVSPGSEPWK